MTDILARIAAYKREEVAERRIRTPSYEPQARETAPPRDFLGALNAAAGEGRPALIAEIKKASPSKGLIRADFDPPALARAYAAGGAACLSVLTDGPSFQGNDAYLSAAREASGLPCLRKDFLVDPWQVAESRVLGADCILVILAMIDDAVASALLAAAADHGMAALVEVHDEPEMNRALALGATLIGVNNRDLRTFQTDLSTTERLAPLAADSTFLVAESGIEGPADFDRLSRAGARAVLVGESLMRKADVTSATRMLLGRPRHKLTVN
jgi:indole-3-glycerol phosphate synthase